MKLPVTVQSTEGVEITINESGGNVSIRARPKSLVGQQLVQVGRTDKPGDQRLVLRQSRRR